MAGQRHLTQPEAAEEAAPAMIFLFDVDVLFVVVAWMGEFLLFRASLDGFRRPERHEKHDSSALSKREKEKTEKKRERTRENTKGDHRRIAGQNFSFEPSSDADV